MEEVQILVDWENIRLALAENYIERVELEDIFTALEAVAKELGGLKECIFYGDFTLRRDEARKIRTKARFDFSTALRSLSQKDRSDAMIVADIMELIAKGDSPPKIVLCSGDSGYCDVVGRALRAGKQVLTCAVARSLSPELGALATSYPLERYLPLKLTPKGSGVDVTAAPPRDVQRWRKFVSVLDSLERRLPFVAFSYVQNTIMPSYRMGGQTSDDRFAYLESARERQIVTVEEIDDPTRLGKRLRILKLNKNTPLVQSILAAK